MIWGFPGGADGYGMERFDITHLNLSRIQLNLPSDAPYLGFPQVRPLWDELSDVIGINETNLWDFETGQMQLYDIRSK